jgi:hypothetical protein
MKNKFLLLFIIIVIYYFFFNYYETNLNVENVENVISHKIEILDLNTNIKQIKKTKVGDIKGLKNKKIGGGEQTSKISTVFSA